MKKGEIYQGRIEKIDFPNKGKVTVEDKTVIVKNGIPGQTVRFLINKKKGKRMEGRLLEVLEKSLLETREPVCSIFPQCGGCMYQTMRYEDQLEMKKNQVKDLLDQALICGGQTDVNGMPDYVFEGIKGSPHEFAYRNKMEFSFGDEYKDGPLALGLHKKGSTYDVLNAFDCKLVHEDMTKILKCVAEYFKARNVSFYKKMQHTGYLRHLLLRRANTTGEILVNLVTTSQEDSDLLPLKDELLALPLEGKIVGFLHIINDGLSDMVRSDETRILYGQDYFYEEILGLKFKVTPFSFFQPNSYGAEVLYRTAREYIGDTKDKVVFDLYSGTGTISQILSPVAKEVIGVEIVEEAVVAAGENAALNGITNCRFIAGDVLKIIDEISEKPDIIVLDPPRDGIHPKALPKIIDYGVDKIVYISCKPTSLARDLEIFIQNGYQVEKCVCVDQFCQTVHVETVCCLHRVNS
ncbi:MAG: 23S rRNA (uracil(1939)-C(5))-methyltransferase RlmD [Blautia sp.]